MGLDGMPLGVAERWARRVRRAHGLAPIRARL
jgi:hypothetical protein